MTTSASKSNSADADPFAWMEDGGYPPPRYNPAARLTSELAAAGLGELPWDGRVGGWLVKTTETHLVHVLPMVFSYRVATTPVDIPYVYDRHWCYVGLGPLSFTAAVLAAHAWDGADTTEPVGWNKNGQSGEWREPAS